VEVRVTDTTEKDFYLDIVFARIPPRDRGRGKRIFRAGSGISLRIILTTLF
jgi:hypothetical protein